MSGYFRAIYEVLPHVFGDACWLRSAPTPNKIVDPDSAASRWIISILAAVKKRLHTSQPGKIVALDLDYKIHSECPT